MGVAFGVGSVSALVQRGKGEQVGVAFREVHSCAWVPGFAFGRNEEGGSAARGLLAKLSTESPK